MHPPLVQLVQVNTRLFRKDIKTIKARAVANGLPWQIELRLLVRRALQAEALSIITPTARK